MANLEVLESELLEDSELLVDEVAEDLEPAPGVAGGYLPIEQVLGGLKIEALGGGEVPMEAFTLIKVCRPDGSMGWSWRATKAPNREELLGALLVQADLLRSELLSDWID